MNSGLWSHPQRTHLFLDAAQVSNPLLPAHRCMHERCLEGEPAVYMFTPLLVEKAGVAPDMTLRFTACKQVSVQARKLPWLWNPWEGSHKVQLGAVSGPTKWTLVQQKILKKTTTCAAYVLKTCYIMFVRDLTLFSHTLPQPTVHFGIRVIC